MATSTCTTSKVYSDAPEAALKKRLDKQILGKDWESRSMDNEAYLKELIKVSSSDRSSTVQDSAKGLQFFIIKGGGEGFLDSCYENDDASNVQEAEPDTDRNLTMSTYKNNDLFIVFNQQGKLVSSTLLSRPLSIPGVIRKETVKAVCDAWDGQPV
jgi:hypothetical protein